MPAGAGKPRSATVVIRAHGVLAGLLDVAVLDRRIASNPARGVKLPRKGKKRRAYLTPTQVELLAKHSGDNATLVYVLAYTGLRWGEAIALRISTLDALRRRLSVEENAVLVGSRIVVWRGSVKASVATSSSSDWVTPTCVAPTPRTGGSRAP